MNRDETITYLEQLLNAERQRSLKYVEGISRMSVLCEIAINKLPDSSERVRLMKRSNEVLHIANDDGLINHLLYRRDK